MLVDKLVEEYAEKIDEAKIAEITLFQHGNECVCSYTICAVLAVVVLTISIGIGFCFVYSRWYLKKDITRVKSSTHTQTTI